MLLIYRGVLGGPLMDIVQYDIDSKFQEVNTCGACLIVFTSTVKNPKGVSYSPNSLGAIVVQYQDEVKEL